MDTADRHWSKHPLTNSIVTAILGSGLLAAVVAVVGARFQADLARRDKQREEYMRDAEYLDKTIDQYDQLLRLHRRYHTVRLELETAKNGKPPTGSVTVDDQQKNLSDIRAKLLDLPDSNRLRIRLKSRFGTRCNLDPTFKSLQDVEWKVATCKEEEDMQVYDMESIDLLRELEAMIYESFRGE
jgi:hypothetical protein